MLFATAFVVLFLILWLAFLYGGRGIERLLAQAAHRTAKFRYRDYLPVVILLAAGLGIAAFAADAFTDIAERLHAESSRMRLVDAEAHEWARTTRTSGATAFFTIMTLIGTPVGLAIIALIVSGFLAMEKRWRWIAYLVFTTTVGGLLNLQLKALFARARPELAEALRHASGYSFPSGHAMGATVCFGALAYLAFRIHTSWRRRAAAAALAATLTLSIAASRIYLGVHWISDVGAGIAAGLIWLTTTTVAYEAFRRIRMIRALRAQSARSSARTSLGE